MSVNKSDVEDSTNITVSKVRLFREPPWKLRLTIDGDRSYPGVKVVRAAPLSYPDRYISILDLSGEEICMVDNPEELDEVTRTHISQELDHRYLTSTVQRINSIRNEFGTSYWEVETDRGEREFVVQNVAENARWLSNNRLLIVDVDGNRFEIPGLDALDKRSQGLMEQTL